MEPNFNLVDVLTRVKREHPELSENQLNEAVKGYKAYWAKCKQSPGNNSMIDPLVDEIWHNHILFTEQYVTDTLTYFGYYLHHRPLGKDICDVGYCDSPSVTKKVICVDAGEELKTSQISRVICNDGEGGIPGGGPTGITAKKFICNDGEGGIPGGGPTGYVNEDRVSHGEVNKYDYVPEFIGSTIHTLGEIKPML